MATSDDAGAGAGPAPAPTLTVAAVARRIGVAPSTLRTWDRRYGLGPSGHTAGAHRRYSPVDLHRLAIMRRLTLEGMAPAEAAAAARLHDVEDEGCLAAVAVLAAATRVEVLPLGAPAGEALPDAVAADAAATRGAGEPDAATPTGAHPPAPAPHAVHGAPPLPAPGMPPGAGPAAGHLLPGPPGGVVVDACQDCCFDRGHEAAVVVAPRRPDAHLQHTLRDLDDNVQVRGLARAALALDGDEVTRILTQALESRGLVQAWSLLIAPVLRAIGARWSSSGEGIDVEHSFTEALTGVLRACAVAHAPAAGPAPVLLACPEGEQHTLPLQALACALAERGVGARLLGRGMPADALVAAVRRTGPVAAVLYARMPVRDTAVLARVSRQRPAPRLLLAGEGWPESGVPAAGTRVDGLEQALAELVSCLEGCAGAHS